MKLFEGNKRGMLSQLIGGFVAIMIGVALIPTIMSQVNMAMTCGNSTIENQTQVNATVSYDKPLGSTNSFGGGGSEHFGGYDGKVTHKQWFDNLAVTDKPILFTECPELSDADKTLFSLVPLFFSLAIVTMAITTIVSALRSAEMM